MDLILDNLDAMAMNKMNVLHWHISDTQSFPYALENLPELATKGAFHPRRIYTPANVRTLVREAYLRGIRVIPEIDMPGHTNAIAASHPEVMSHCPKASEPMNPTVPETYDFIYQIYRDLDAIFPDNMVHLGGDEVQLSEACWLKDPRIAKWMRDHGMKNKTVELYEYFEVELLKTIKDFGKIPIVWQEVFDLNLTISKDSIIDVWKGFDRYSIQNATNKGYRVILSGCWYLDHLDQTWEKFYKCDPLNFTSPNKDLMIGGHASMWAEHVDASNFVSRVWPRASSAAERLWHGTSGDAAKAAAANIAERIHKFRCRMVLMGFAAGPTGPGVCPTEVTYARRGEPDRIFTRSQARDRTIDAATSVATNRLEAPS
jgi:hexosaminidase